MKKHPLAVLVPGLFTAAALALALSVGAQEPAAVPKADAPMAAPMAHHHQDCAARAEHKADMQAECQAMMAECQAMMAKKQEMQDKLQAMDVRLDNLVAEMNAASTSTAPDAMETMAAVITEAVAQRKATRSMMMEMQPEMMAHMMHHRDMHGAKGTMDCPMMKAGKAKAEEAMPAG